jgi:hypothetical protein
MNDRSTILKIIRHPLIKRLMENKIATSSVITKLIAEELLEQDQNKYEGQIEKLIQLTQSKKFTNFSAKINKFLVAKPKGLEAFSANMGEMDPQQLLEILGDTNEWFRDRKKQIEQEAKAGKFDYAAFLLQGEFEKWEAQYKEAYEAYSKATGASETGKPDQQSYNKFRAIVLVWQDMFKSAVQLIQASQDAEDKSGDREELAKSLLEAKDITEFINIYRKLAGEEYKEQLEQTVKVIRTLAALKKKKPDLQPGDKNMENILRSEWTAKKAFMDLEKIADRIKAKMVELITGIEGEAEKTGAKPPFDQMLMALRKAGNMKNKLEIVRVRFPQYMTPEYGLTTLDNLNDYKDLFMAVVKGKTTELDEAKTPQIKGTSKESRQFLIGILAYYKLSEKESYEKIKADDEKFKKELARIMKAADHMDSFNKPLADALRKFVKDQQKEDCIALLKKLIEMFTSKYNLDEEAFAQLTVKIKDIYMAGNKPESDEEKKNILEKFNSTLKPFIEEFSEKIDNFVKMYKEDTEQCKEKVDALKDSDTPKYKIAMFFINYREILEKMGTPPPDSAPTPETIELAQDAIDNYIKNFDLFCTKFLNVKTLHAQSELFRLFYATLFGIAGINPDTIVGDQITAYTETAMPDLRVDEALLENEGQRQLTKDIAQNAKVVERHANAILEILDGYEKYLNIGEKDEKTGKMQYKRGTKGVEQGSRELFNKFGESDPKKLINKFVKLIVKDINGTIEAAEQLIAQADAASAETEKSEPEEPGGEEAPAKRNDLLTEAPVDNSVRDLPTREKIVLVVKTGKKVCEIGARLKDMIAKEKREGGDEEPQGDQGTQGDQGDQGEGKRDDLREAPTMASDARINPDPTGPDKDPGDLRKMQARQGDEINVGYRELAKEMHDLMTKIRPLFPTSQPFDTNYDFSVAKTAFKAALKGLSSHVAQVSGFEFDQVTSKEVLRSFKVKLEAFRKVIKDVFGFSEELKQAKEQASFNEEGEKSGMPHAGDGDDDKDKSPGNTTELNEKLKGVIKDYENTQYILNMIMATSYDDSFIEENSKMFVPLITSQAGKITKSIKSIQSANQVVSQNLQMDFKKIEGDIEKASEGNFKAAYNSLEQKVISWLKRIINSKDIMPLEEDEKSNTGEKARISQTGAAMIKVMSIYFLIKRVSEKIDEGNELQEDEIKEMDELIKELLKNASLMTTIIKRYPIKEKEKDFSERAKMYYKNFHRFKIPGFIPTGKSRQEDPKGKKPEPGGDEGNKKKRPPEDFETEKETTGPSRRRKIARRRAATNESVLANKLKPLIREMLNKGK